MFTEIGIENFKSFGKMQRIPLKPITLLYGPNSSGKSSLLQSLLLFKQTLGESGDDKIVLLPKGNLVDLGGYQEFINGHDAKKDFRMSISFKYSWEEMEWYDWMWEPKTCPDLSLDFSFSQEKSGEILLTSITMRDSFHFDPIMEWKNIWKMPYLKRAVLKRKTEFEKEGVTSEIIDRWLSDLKRSVMVLDHINLAHHLVKHYWNGFAEQLFKKHIQGGKVILDTTAGYCDPTNGSCKQTKTELTKLMNYLEKESQEIEAEYARLNENDSGMKDEKLEEMKEGLKIREAKFRQLEKILKLSKIIHHTLMHSSYGDFLKIRNFPSSNRLISLANCFPNDKEIDLRGEEGWLFRAIPEFAELGKATADTTEIYDTFNHILNLLPDASSYFKEFLRRIVYIGPLRNYMERAYSYSGNVSSSVGKAGQHTPDILSKEKDIVAKVNEWFDKFDIGYELEVIDLKRNLFSISLVDKKTRYKVSPKDVGFGIGQLLPILVQGILSKNKIVCIEQPEIHLHPRLQAELGSFLAEAAGRTSFGPLNYPCEPHEEEYGNQFIIETHSESLILRLQKLIRTGELKKEDVAVIYCDKTPDGTVATELRLNDKGEFIDPWPQGFFEESFKEMFGD